MSGASLCQSATVADAAISAQPLRPGPARAHTPDPGDDFYQYVNGEWFASATIPEDVAAIGIDLDLSNKMQLELRDLINLGDRTSKAAMLYASYMDEDRINSLDAAPLAPDLSRIAAVRNKEEFAELLGALSSHFGSTLYSAEVEPDPHAPGVGAVAIDQDDGGLPSSDYVLAECRPKLEAYRAFVVRALSMSGDADPTGSAAKVIAFEAQLAAADAGTGARHSTAPDPRSLTLNELIRYAPDFPWRHFLAGADVKPESTLVIDFGSGTRAVARLYARTPLSTLKSWEAFHTVEEASPYLSERFQKSLFDFQKTLDGVVRRPPRWQSAVKLVSATLGDELGRAYVEHYFPASAKREITEMVANLKRAMAARIEDARWMAPGTKSEALDKLARMQVMVGYPESWRDYPSTLVTATDLYGNAERSLSLEYAYQNAAAGHAVDRRRWDMSPQTIDAYNDGLENKIVFPAGILQTPFFDPLADPAANYGGIGAVIGHEISHGFDGEGRKIDATGASRNWWSRADARRFRTQAHSLARQFDSFEPVPGAHIDGVSTLDENIADLAGLTIALDAYHQSLNGRPAPIIDGYTGDQRFFIAFAQSFREKARDDYVRGQLVSDPHAPARFRVIGTVRNVDAWYDAFHVPPTAHYYLAPADRVRLW